MIWAVVLLIAASAGLLVWGVANLSPAQTRTLRNRLEELRSGESSRRELQERRRRQQRREQLQELLETVGRRLTGETDSGQGETRKMLIHAGYRHENAVAIFYAVRLFLAAVLVVATLVLGSMIGTGASQGLAFLAFFGLLGWMGPLFFVRRRQKNRQEEIQRALPDALDLLVVCMEAGLGLNQALMRVAEEMDRISGVLAEELMIVNMQIRAGNPRSEALRGLAERTGISDVRSLVGMLVQTDRFGTSVGEALRVHADTLRDKRRQRAEEEAAKLSIRMLFPLVFFIFPSIFVVMLGPSVFRFQEIFGGM